MRVVLYGATGRGGTRILRALLSRGHHVRAVTRELGVLAPQENLEISVDDLSDVARTTDNIRGADAVISAYAPPQEPLSPAPLFLARRGTVLIQAR